MISAQDNQPANENKELIEFVRSLVEFSPQEAAAKLTGKLLSEEAAGQAYFDNLVMQAERLVETLALPAAWQRALREELKLARGYEVEEPIIPTVPIATPLLAAVTSGELDQVLNALLKSPTGLVSLLAEQALRQHKAKVADEWESIRFLDMLLHMSKQETCNPDNQQALREWVAGAKLREERLAQEQSLPERKQVVTEADRPRLEQRLAKLMEHWEIRTNPLVQATVELIGQRLTELDTQPYAALNEKYISEASHYNTVELLRDVPFKVTARRIALIHIFNKQKPIRLTDWTHNLGREHGYVNGNNIYQYYIKYSKEGAIFNASDGELPSLIKDIELVLPLVNKRYQQGIANELNALKKR